MPKQSPAAPSASAIHPCRTIIQIIGHPSIESLPKTFAPPDQAPSLQRWTNFVTSFYFPQQPLPFEMESTLKGKQQSTYK